MLKSFFPVSSPTAPSKAGTHTDWRRNGRSPRDPVTAGRCDQQCFLPALSLRVRLCLWFLSLLWSRKRSRHPQHTCAFHTHPQRLLTATRTTVGPCVHGGAVLPLRRLLQASPVGVRRPLDDLKVTSFLVTRNTLVKKFFLS